MSIISCIMKVVRTEALILSRSWVFRFFAVASVAMLVLIYIGYYGRSSGGWSYRSIPSSVVYYNVIAMTLLQSMVVPFCAFESIRRETAFDTSESIYIRNFRNVWYITGKALGVMIPFLVLSIAILPAVWAANAIFLIDAPVVWQAYLYYPFIISVPALVWLTGLSFFVARMVRIQALALITITAYSVYAFTQLGGPVERIIDFTGFHLPLLYSDFVGFGTLHGIVFHRLAYLFGGVALIAASGVRFRRLSQSRTTLRWGIFTTVISAFLAVFVGCLFLTDNYGGIVLRRHMNKLAQEYVGHPRARVSRYVLDIDHRGRRLDVTATLSLLNSSDRPLETLIFTLNPGFRVRDIESEGREITYDRDAQILLISPSSPLNPGVEMELTITYEGACDNDACYIDIDENERAIINRIFLAGIEKCYGFVTPDYALLTPESTWYPVSGIPYGWVFPEAYYRDFAEYEVTVHTRDDMTVISQADIHDIGEGSSGFATDERLPGLTLIIGHYEKKTLTIDGIEYSMYVRPGHDYFSQYLTDAEEIATRYIREARQQVEIENGMTYPFRRYLIVETPVQFMAYERPWRTHTEIVQPQMALMPERGAFMLPSNTPERYAFQSASQKNAENPLYENTVSESLIREFIVHVMATDKYLANTVASLRSSTEVVKRGRFGNMWMNILGTYGVTYDPAPQFYSFLTSIESDRYPVFNAVMEYYHKRGISIELNQRERSLPLTDMEVACIAFEQDSFSRLIGQDSEKGNISKYIDSKAIQLFSPLGAYAGIGESADVINQFIQTHCGMSVALDDFVSMLTDSLGWDMSEFLDTWYNSRELPVYSVTKEMYYPYESGPRTYYQTLYTVTNQSDVPGTVLCEIEYTEENGMRETISRYVSVAGQQSKEIGFITYQPPWRNGINTIMSRNIPIIIEHSLRESIHDGSGPISFEGEREVPYQPLVEERNAIIVDDLDPGFAILNEPIEMTDRNVIRTELYPEGFMSRRPGYPEKQWVKASFRAAYGFPKQTARYTGPGSGEGRVGWTARIEEAGTYDLSHYFFNRGSDMIYGVGGNHPLSNWPLLGEYLFTVVTTDSSYTLQMVPSDDGGWQHLGTFDLKPGAVTVELSNNSTGILIYADAVKWVRK